VFASAWAHDGAGHPDLWTLDPTVLALLGLAAVLYWRGSLRLGARQACFGGGLAVLLVALVFPLDALGERFFWAHMLQHAALMNLAAPLLVLGAPLGPMLRALPAAWRAPLARLGAGRRWRRAWRWLSGLALATVLQQAVLWLWHAPRGVAAALESDALHVAMHASLLAAALLFWTAVLKPRSRHYWGPIAALLATLQLTGMICIVLLLQPLDLYPAYGGEDEQLGWGLMMIAGTLSYLGAAVTLAGASLSVDAGVVRRTTPRRAVR
jgi:putative membrane protein